MVNTVPGICLSSLAMALSLSLWHVGVAMFPAPTSTGLVPSGGLLACMTMTAIVTKTTNTTTAMTQYGTLAIEPLNLNLSVL
jgi:hypothetical protein